MFRLTMSLYQGYETVSQPRFGSVVRNIRRRIQFRRLKRLPAIGSCGWSGHPRGLSCRPYWGPDAFPLDPVYGGYPGRLRSFRDPRLCSSVCAACGLTVGLAIEIHINIVEGKRRPVQSAFRSFWSVPRRNRGGVGLWIVDRRWRAGSTVDTAPADSFEGLCLSLGERSAPPYGCAGVRAVANSQNNLCSTRTRSRTDGGYNGTLPWA